MSKLICAGNKPVAAAPLAISDIDSSAAIIHALLAMGRECKRGLDDLRIDDKARTAARASMIYDWLSSQTNACIIPLRLVSSDSTLRSDTNGARALFSRCAVQLDDARGVYAGGGRGTL